MISSDGRQESLTYLLHTLCNANPSVAPKKWMTDCDMAQINSICDVYPESVVFYCWWHVLHAWQQHFSTHAFPELWVQLKLWIRIEDEKEFSLMKEKVQKLSPPSFWEYLKTYYLKGLSRSSQRDIYLLPLQRRSASVGQRLIVKDVQYSKKVTPMCS